VVIHDFAVPALQLVLFPGTKEHRQLEQLLGPCLQLPADHSGHKTVAFYQSQELSSHRINGQLSSGFFRRLMLSIDFNEVADTDQICALDERIHDAKLIDPTVRKFLDRIRTNNLIDRCRYQID
jgi:hypothetical protein